MSPADRADNGPIGFSDDPLLLLHYTAFCNASCAHCIVESGPQRKGRMSLDLAGDLIEGAGGVPHLRTVVFSGGESFIYLDDVLQLCAQARAEGLVTRIISNGYWARTPEIAARMLERLGGEAVDQLVISFGEFHRAFIPAERVRNVFLGARQASAAPFVAYSTVIAGVRDDPTIDVGGYAWPTGVLRCLADYGFAAEECVPLAAAVARGATLAPDERTAFKKAMVHERALINYEPLAFGGRASRELRDRQRLRPIEQDAGTPCSVVGRQITAVTSGRLYPCCSVWTNFPNHALGVADSATDMPAMVDDMQMDALVRFIHERGPGPLIAQLRQAGVPLAGEYSDICHMCQTLFEHVSLDDLRQAAALAFNGANRRSPDEGGP
jgi:hypothetical protein